jgi:hypothetical protein
MMRKDVFNNMPDDPRWAAARPFAAQAQDRIGIT